MLDLYVTGVVDRISPEAPIPVLKQVAVREVPGGAANVAANVVSLGGRAHLLASAGTDHNQVKLAKLLSELGINCDFVQDESRPTTVKTRFMANQHQLLRLDCEDASPLGMATEDALLSQIRDRLETGGVLVLSDYGKGLLTDRVLASAIEIARSLNAVVIVDPKRRNFARYAGAHYIKPNRSELAIATGLPTSSDAEVAAAALKMARLTGASLLVTRAEHGMSLVRPSGEVHHLLTHAREVYDVSGAGDTAIAAFALGLRSGYTDRKAMLLANIAAGIAVSKVGTTAVSRDELVAEIQRASQGEITRGMLVSAAKASEVRSLWKQVGLTVGFTNGCFDLLHPGHIKLLQEAAQQCDRLIVGLNSDASVRRLKGHSRPVQSANDRAAVLGALEAVSLVVVFDEDTPRDLISNLAPDVLVKGADYSIDEIVGADTVLSAGGRVLTVDLVPGRSTSHLIKASNSAGKT
jgi:D-beta-D-heptose 7-phosphate kinase/D-beta-D-heptose 1-phosphate adenosyltransferase